MTKNLFSVPIFFIVFRETLEAAIIVSVLLGLAEQIVHEDPNKVSTATSLNESTSGAKTPVDPEASSTPELLDETTTAKSKRLIRRLRFQIFLGAGIGLLIAIAIGAAFIAVWFTKASDLWAKSEALWEGIFELIACIMIFFMGISMLKMDRAKAKWRVKLQRAFDGKHVDGRTSTGRWALFVLPLITVLREGIEAVVFVGGVSLGQPATSIPIAAIVGIICGLICGYLIYGFASRTTLTVFLVVMTNFLLLIGAGLFSKAVGDFQEHAFNTLLGADVDDSGGSGPGSYDVRGNVWHLTWGNPDATTSGQGWTIFNAILGWTNNATIGSVLAYVFYWVAVMVFLVNMKFKEGRVSLFGKHSAAGLRRQTRRAVEASKATTEKEKGREGTTTLSPVIDVQELPRG